MHSFQKSRANAIISLLAIITGVSVIVGWAFNLPGLETIFPKYDSMKFNTAVCFILLGSALFTTQLQGKKNYKPLFFALSALAALIGALSLSQDIFHYNSGMDQLFIIDKDAIAEKYPYPGRMAANVSACFLLFGLAFIGFCAKNSYLHIVSQYFLHLITAISAVAIMGYLYGLSLFYKLSFVGSMAVHTAVLLLFMSIIATLLHPSLGIANLFTGRLVGNKMAKRLFLLIVSMVIIFGSLMVQSQRRGFLSVETGDSLLAVCFLFVSLLLIWYTANWLNRIDLKRYEAEEEVKAMNEELEERVNERSAALFDLLEKYKESESKFRTAFEFSAIGMALVSLEGNWLKVNKRLCEMLGYTEQELLSMSFMDITHPDDITEGVNLMRAATTRNEVYRLEKRYLCKNGAMVWASVNMAPVLDNNGKPQYLVSQIEDITERKKTGVRFRAIVESVFVGINLNDANWNIIYRSPSMQAFNGWTDEEMDQNFLSLVHPDDLVKVKRIRNEVLTNPGKSINLVYRLLTTTGNYIWIESLICNKLSDPDIGAIVIVTRDITERKVVEDQLKKSEEKYHSLIEHASDAIYLLDLEGNFIDANESMCKMTGYTIEELLQLNIDTLIDPDQLRTDPLPLGSLDPDLSVLRERRLLGKDGQVFDVEINVKMFADDQVLVIARDIADRKRMEEGLREAELKFRTLAEKSMVGVYISKHERFIYVNPRFAEIFGYEPDELINTTESAIKIIIDESDQEVVWKNVQARYKGETENAHYEIRGKKKDGTFNYVEFYGNRVVIDGEPAIIGTMLDITERKKAEEELRSSEHKYKLLFESNPQPLSMIAKDDLSIIAVNSALARLYGYTEEELLMMKATIFRPSEDLDQQLEIFMKDTSRSNDLGVMRHVRKDGSVMFVHIIGHDIIFEGRSVRLSLITDITEKLKAEEELQKSQANLKAIMDTTDTAYALLDKKLRIIAYNHMAVKFGMSQYNHIPARGDQLTDLLQKERLPKFVKNADEALKGKNISYEINYPQTDGSVFWYDVKLFPITNDKQEVFGLMMSLLDITERKNAEESLRAAYNLIQDHISSIKDMAWKQSHLIRSPLANLKGLAALLKDDPSNSEILGFINIELERLDTVIIDMAEEASNHDV